MDCLKELTELKGVSGNEDSVREHIYNKIIHLADKVEQDSMGNLYAYKKGTKNLTVMLSAHMDEVGFMVTGYTESGCLKFRTVGGIDSRILLNKNVIVGDNNNIGIIGAKPIHLQSASERSKNIDIKNMFIDIGAKNKEEAKSTVSVGEYLTFDSKYVEFGEDKIKAKALDDRAGCAILLEMLKSNHNYNLVCVFTVQEEVGLRGAKVAAERIKPDIAIVVESTTCADQTDVDDKDKSTIVEGGAVFTAMDRTCVNHKGLLSLMIETAKQNNIKYQFKRTTAGGNDAGAIHLSAGGIITAAVSIPCRYIHSPVSVMSKKDYLSVRNLITKLLDRFDEKGIIDYIKERQGQ